MTPHNEAKKEDIAKIVITPGDPLRAKYIAENFLENAVLVNSVRAMYAYTGYYHGTRITVMASGMGMPSMGIYSYELFKIYDVDYIIRIGSCGAYDPKLSLFDIVLSETCFSEGNYALTFNNDNCHLVDSDKELNSIIMQTAREKNIRLITGNTVCTDSVDFYMTDVTQFLSRLPQNFHPISAEMEAFSLFYNAQFLHKKASCLMSVVDSQYIDKVATTEERQTGLNQMITLALESATHIGKGT